MAIYITTFRPPRLVSAHIARHNVDEGPEGKERALGGTYRYVANNTIEVPIKNLYSQLHSKGREGR